jgi:hypothetical protein
VISPISAVESSRAFFSEVIHMEDSIMDAEIIIKRPLINIIP